MPPTCAKERPRRQNAFKGNFNLSSSAAIEVDDEELGSASDPQVEEERQSSDDDGNGEEEEDESSPYDSEDEILGEIIQRLCG